MSTPTFASCSCSPWKARLAISSETVKPIPATTPLLTRGAQPTGSLRPGRSRDRIQVAPAIPTGFPTT